MNEERWILGAVSVIVAGIAYIASCGLARAEEHEIRLRNPGTVAYTAVETPWGTVPVDCQPGATCSVRVDIPWGQYPALTIRGLTGQQRSDPSNALDRKVYPPDPERADFDGSRTVTVSDFGRFLQQLGAVW